MSTLSAFSASFLEDIRVREDQLINCIWSEGTRHPMSATESREIKCLKCGSVRGYLVRDVFKPDERGWACLEDGCLSYWSFKHLKVERDIDLEVYGVPARLRGAVFKDLKQDEKVRSDAKAYAKSGEGPLLICGPNGTGKSYLAACVVREAVKFGRTCRFFNVSDVYSAWMREFQAQSPHHLEVKISEVSLLVLDDMGQKSPSEGFLDFLYRVINRRYNAMSPTVVTTNLTGVEFSETFDKAILSRISCGKIIKLDGVDKR